MRSEKFRRQAVNKQGCRNKNKHITEFRKSNPLLEKAQIQLMNENVAAIKAYQKIGFEIAENKTSNNPDITNLLPGKTKLMLQKIIID